MATSGPGATNLVTGIATAYMDSVPMVAITANVTLPLLGKDSFQEVDITGITMPVTKHNFAVKRVEDLADIIRRAFQIAQSGRPGPVLIDVPIGMQQKSIPDFDYSRPVDIIGFEYEIRDTGVVMMATPVSSAMRWMVRPTLALLHRMSRDASFSIAHSWLS